MNVLARTLTLGAAALTIAATPAEVPVTWNVDASHSKVGFSVRHFFTPVEGSFDQYTAELVWDREAPENSTVNVTIQVASINTGNTDRDGHLATPDFFDAAQFPEITFESTSVAAEGDDTLLVTGDLTIKDVTREVTLPVRLLGVQELPQELQEMFGGITEIASFETELEIDRRDFGVGTGGWAETAVVGGPVTITIQLEANHS
jgi:polyisoprenoid-binding protein YceI